MKVELCQVPNIARVGRVKPPVKKRGWREAEAYFRTYRDGKVPVTLPRVSCLEEAPRE